MLKINLLNHQVTYLNTLLLDHRMGVNADIHLCEIYQEECLHYEDEKKVKEEQIKIDKLKKEMEDIESILQKLQ